MKAAWTRVIAKSCEKQSNFGYILKVESTGISEGSNVEDESLESQLTPGFFYLNS